MKTFQMTKGLQYYLDLLNDENRNNCFDAYIQRGYTAYVKAFHDTDYKLQTCKSFP